jgi:tetratricopeptide (TPR) repeat protein
LLARAAGARRRGHVYNYGLGLEIVDQGKTQEAEKHFRRALEIQPDNARIYNALGNICIQTGGLTESLAHYCEGLEIKLDFVDALNDLVVGLSKAGRFGEAIGNSGKLSPWTLTANRHTTTWDGCSRNLGNWMKPSNILK